MALVLPDDLREHFLVLYAQLAGLSGKKQLYAASPEVCAACRQELSENQFSVGYCLKNIVVV